MLSLRRGQLDAPLAPFVAVPAVVSRPTHSCGPFRPSYIGGYRYSLVLVDDHSRFKFVYHMAKKSEAPQLVRRFVAAFNGKSNSTSQVRTRMVGALHTDNAGELVSREFQELMDHESIDHTTSPPHVHQLNGVAERSIRSVSELARSYLVAGHVPAKFWPLAFDMAVDVLNRTSGPEEKVTSYEMLTGNKPRIMNIMPFGCRAFAVKPREQYSKTDLDPRAWVGVNLGRSLSTPGAYRVYIPETGRVLLTSEVYFWENYFPLRPRSERFDEEAPGAPVAAHDDGAQPPGVPTPAGSAPDTPASANSLSALAPESFPASSNTSRRALVLFSRPYARPDGIAAFLRARGVESDQLDSHAVDGGGPITIFSTTRTSSPCSN